MSSVTQLTGLSVLSSGSHTESLSAYGMRQDKDSVYYRGLAVIAAVRQRKIDELKQLLKDSATISNEHRGKAVWEATRQLGNLEVLKLLLPDEATISRNDRGKSVIHTVEVGDLEMFKFLLENQAVISPESKGEALEKAFWVNKKEVELTGLPFGYDRTEMIKRLLVDRLEVPLENKQNAIESAVCHNNLPGLQLLLDPLEPSPLIADGIISAVFYNNLEALQLLLKERESVWESVVRVQGGLRNIELDHLLLSRGQTGRLSPVVCPVKDLALMHSAVKGNLEMVRFLLSVSDFSVDINVRGLAVRGAIRCGHLEILALLLQNGAISPEDQGEALKMVVENPQRIMMLAPLFNCPGGIASEAKNGILSRAIYRKNLDAAVWLLTQLSPGEISLESKNIALQTAASENAIVVLDLLVKDPEITPESKVQALKLAAISNRRQALELLLDDSEQISSDDGDIAFVDIAADLGNLDLIEKLLSINPTPISSAAIGWALIRAINDAVKKATAYYRLSTSDNHLKMVAFLFQLLSQIPSEDRAWQIVSAHVFDDESKRYQVGKLLEREDLNLDPNKAEEILANLRKARYNPFISAIPSYREWLKAKNSADFESKFPQTVHDNPVSDVKVAESSAPIADVSQKQDSQSVLLTQVENALKFRTEKDALHLIDRTDESSDSDDDIETTGISQPIPSVIDRINAAIEQYDLTGLEQLLQGSISQDQCNTFLERTDSFQVAWMLMRAARLGLWDTVCGLGIALRNKMLWVWSLIRS